MSDYRLHWIPKSGNAYKVASYLCLVDADWHPVRVDFCGGETLQDKWRSNVNEMGEIPVLEHAGERITQSGLILHYLAERHVRFGAVDEMAAREIWRWILFDNHKLTGSFATYRWLRTFATPRGHSEVLAFLRSRADGALSVLEKHLQTSDFVVGAAPTIADISLSGYLYFPEEETGYDLASAFPGVFAWTQRIAALPGWRHPYEVAALFPQL
jgi:glutathione S-transferase